MSRFLSKKSVRSSMLSARNNLDALYVRSESSIISEKLIKSNLIRANSKVSIYLHVWGEVQTNLIIDYLIGKKCQVFIPAYSNKKKSYVLSKYSKGVDLIEGRYKVLQPLQIDTIDPRAVEISIFPGLAFTKKGLRVGYGKGVFDKLFEQSKAFKIGLAFDFQIVDDVRAEKHDLRMSCVITEKRIINVKLFNN